LDYRGSSSGYLIGDAMQCEQASTTQWDLRKMPPLNNWFLRESDERNCSGGTFFPALRKTRIPQSAGWCSSAPVIKPENENG
jgi:hypothetical protein